MTDEVLSQAEVESLLNAMETKAISPSPSKAAPRPTRDVRVRATREDHALRFQTP